MDNGGGTYQLASPENSGLNDPPDNGADISIPFPLPSMTID